MVIVDGLDTQTLYCGRVLARIRRPRGLTSSGTWTTLKGGFAGVELVVTRAAVRVQLIGRASRWIVGSIQPDLRPSDCTMEIAPVGWIGLPLFAKDCIVLSEAGGSRLQVAVRPADGDLRRAWTALRDAGVIATSEAPE